MTSFELFNSEELDRYNDWDVEWAHQKWNFKVMSEIIQKFLISDQEEVWKISNNQHSYKYEQNHHQKCKFIIKLWKLHKKFCQHDYVITTRLLCWLWSNEIEWKIKKYDNVSDFSEIIENDNYIGNFLDQPQEPQEPEIAYLGPEWAPELNF